MENKIMLILAEEAYKKFKENEYKSFKQDQIKDNELELYDFIEKLPVNDDIKGVLEDSITEYVYGQEKQNWILGFCEAIILMSE